eukprot:3417039-Pyramimonas_sp.AAC.1
MCDRLPSEVSDLLNKLIRRYQKKYIKATTGAGKKHHPNLKKALGDRFVDEATAILKENMGKFDPELTAPCAKHATECRVYPPLGHACLLIAGISCLDWSAAGAQW